MQSEAAHDTIHGFELPEGAREWIARICAGEGALAKELERILEHVRKTEVDEDRLCILVRRASAPRDAQPVMEMHLLDDGAVAVPTPWIMSSRDRVVAKIVGEHQELLREHDDVRGIPCFPSALLPTVLEAGGYEAALKALGSAISFL